jgi:hypothetical protein
MDNGELIFVGKRFVERIGTYTTLLTEDDLKAIRQNGRGCGLLQIARRLPYACCRLSEMHHFGKH